MNGFKETQERLGLSNAQMARYLNLPENTLAKWRNGERKPTASATQLLHVLYLIEKWCPELHDILKPGK